MEIPSEDLRRSLRDLVAFTALPTLWRDYSPHAIAESLCDALLSTLQLDVVYIRLVSTDSLFEIAQTPHQLYTDKQAADIGSSLNSWSKIDSNKPVQSVANPFGNGTLSIATMHIGYGKTDNIVAIGKQAPNRLTDADTLLLRVASNQAATALRQAQLLADLQAVNTEKDVVFAQEQRAREEAEQATQTRGEFLSVAAHELRTPITSLRGFVQLMLRQLDKHGTVDLKQLRRALETIDHQSTKLTHLVSQLLDLSRIESGRLIIEPEMVDLVPLVKDAASTIQKSTERHIISVRIPSTLVTVVDPLRIEQVMINLLNNAVKYSPNGGPIDVEVSTPDAQTAKIAVTDSGMGIPLERREHIFKRYYQAHGNGYQGGMGLGLYISHQIIDLHGGAIRAEFPAAQGTRFVIELPITSI